jgi:ABC-2 type transport system ATP-binding protein
VSPASSAEPRAEAQPRRAGPPAGPGSPAIYAADLRKQYRRTVALAGLSMTVGRGEVFGFLGPNGAGKTTAVKLLLGLSRPSSGEAMVLGAPAGDRETRRRIGYLPELFRFQGWLTAREVLTLHSRLLGLPRGGRAAAADDALGTVGLAGRGDDKVGTFSKGMQQRLGLGVALLGQPDLVILDEPTSALDPVGRHQVRAVIRGLRDRGAAVFLNTHLLEEAEQVCDRVAVLDHGRCLATGTLSQLRGRRATVRLRVTGLPGAWWRSLAADARWTAEGEWAVAQGLPSEQVPDLVAEIVARGGRVEAVVPEQESLEARFLDLLGES